MYQAPKRYHTVSTVDVTHGNILYRCHFPSCRREWIRIAHIRIPLTRDHYVTREVPIDWRDLATETLETLETMLHREVARLAREECAYPAGDDPRDYAAEL